LTLVSADAITAWDRDASDGTRTAAKELSRQDVRVVLGGDGLGVLEQPMSPRCVIKSPGIAPRVPVLMEARRRGLPVIDELELGWRTDGRPVVAVTGTNGKSTVSMLAVALLNASGAHPVLGGNVNPGPPVSALVPGDGDVVVCEVSSFQLEACPTFLPEAAVFTNLTQEHLDRHVTMRRYGAAKRRMFVRGGVCVPVAVVNVDDRFGAALAEAVSARGGRVVRYGGARAADYRLADCRWSVAEGRLSAHTPRGRVELSTRLPGRHNALNALAALALADALDIPRARALPALCSAAGLPGRFEAIGGDQPFDVIIDYAHNPAGVRQALEAGRAIVTARGGDACLRVVCSAPRIRLEYQRRMVGRIAASLADHLILTTERWPDTDAAVGLPEGLEAALVRPRCDCEVVLDRLEAIECAVRAARPGDLVMILGRGNLDGALLDRAGRCRPFDDRVAARRALSALAPARQRA
jgi:UDP-N-acetylmuramoyl-L-alanyl-D-glutamate--2,6-diaminopimelate ligase